MKMKHILLLGLFAHAMITAADEQKKAIVEHHPFDLNSPELIATFDALQKIHDIARKKGLRNSPMIRYLAPEPSYGVNQTEQGLYLYIDDETYQIYAATPWGRSEIVDEHYNWGGRTEPKDGMRTLFWALRRSFTLSFVKNSEERKVSLFWINEDDNGHDPNQAISLSELEQYRGTDVEILTAFGGVSMYAVLADKDKPLPKPKMLPDPEDCKACWNGLMQKHKAQKAHP